MSHAYTFAMVEIFKGNINLATDDIRVLLLKAAGSTTCDTEKDKQTISGFTTLGELSATNYVRKALASEAVNQDDPNLRAEFDATDVTWTALGGASNDTIGGVLVHKFVTDDTDSIPLFYIDGFTALPTNGSDVVLTFDAQGIAQLANA